MWGYFFPSVSPEITVTPQTRTGWVSALTGERASQSHLVLLQVQVSLAPGHWPLYVPEHFKNIITSQTQGLDGGASQPFEALSPHWVTHSLHALAQVT